MKSTLFLGIFWSLLMLFPFANLVAQEGRIPELSGLRQSPKLIQPQAVWEDFEEGKDQTRIIVTLRTPPAALGIRLSPQRGRRAELRGRVRETVWDFTTRLDGSQIRDIHAFEYLFGFSARVTPGGMARLLNDPDVLSVEKDLLLHAHLARGIPLINASLVRNLYNGAGVAIAICDTGVDYRHPRLGGGGFPNSKVIGGYDWGDKDDDPMDVQGHGTACAGIAAGDLGTVGNYIGGVAHQARIYAVKISFGSGGSAWTSDMVRGWEWCITHQYDDPSHPILVISTSFGGGRHHGYCDSQVSAMTTAARNAVDSGITLFASTGNDGYCDAMNWPACISHVIPVGAVYSFAFGDYYPCVSEDSCASKYATWSCLSRYHAIDSTAADRVTSYSNTSSLVGLLAPSNQATTTDIIGGGGYSGGDYYPYFGGTSAACPYAAGAAASLQSASIALTGTYLTPAQVRNILTSTGDSIVDSKVAITKPRVNLARAISVIEPMPHCPGCSGEVVVLENVVFPRGISCECIANTSITAGKGVVIPNGARVTFRAPMVQLDPGFQIQAGGWFEIDIQPGH